MKKIIIGFLLLSTLAFSEEFKNEQLQDGESYDFSLENTEFDLNNDGIKDIIKFDKKLPNVVFINGKKFQPVGKLPIESFILAKKNSQNYIGFVCRIGEFYNIKAYMYDGKALQKVPKDKEKEKLKIELETKIKAITSKTSKSFTYDYYKENKIEVEECESSVYSISYDNIGNIISVSHDAVSSTSESGLTETQYYENGVFKYLKLMYWNIYDEETEIIGEIENGKVKSYVLKGKDEIKNIAYDNKKYDEDYYEVSKSFIKNNKFIKPKE